MKKLTVKQLLADGYVKDCELGGNAWYKKGNSYIVWCLAHDRLLQKMQWIGDRFKIL